MSFDGCEAVVVGETGSDSTVVDVLEELCADVGDVCYGNRLG